MQRSDGEFRAAVAKATELLGERADGLVPARLTDADYFATIAEVESLGRLVDSFRVRLAGDAPDRAGGTIDTFGALGHRSPVEAIAALTGVSERTARDRIRTGSALTPGVAITGQTVPPRYPEIARAVSTGALGVEAASHLVRELDSVGSRVDAEVRDLAETGLVALAAATSERPPLAVDLVRIQTRAYVARIDPDGARPREERMIRRRSLTFGPETIDGHITVHGRLTTDVGAQFRRLVDATIHSVAFRSAADEAGATDGTEHGTEQETERGAVARILFDPSASGGNGIEHVADHTGPADTRTRAQKRHDALASILGAASRVADAPSLAGAPPAVIVTVTQDALDAGVGVGFIDGTETPVPLRAVERFIDAGGSQTVTMSRAGRVLGIGSVQRCFTPTQRRGIIARDGGCIIPGCPVPAGWCEVHHVIPHRDGGPTHIDNGVLLCWWHHRTIDSGPWRISMPAGAPHIRGPAHPNWTPVTKSRTREAPPRPLTG